MLLVQGCRAYYDAMWAKGDEKAELIYMGNMHLTVSEQTRLQSDIGTLSALAQV